MIEIVERDNIIIKQVTHINRFDINIVVAICEFCLLVRITLLTFHYYFFTAVPCTLVAHKESSFRTWTKITSLC